MKTYVLYLVLLSSLAIWHIYTFFSIEKELLPTIESVVVGSGYSLRTYVVRTEDDYLLTLHRISKGPVNISRPVMFLQHGIISSSSVYVSIGKNLSLGFLSVDRGYDVWLGNARGNKYSSKHLRLKPSEPEFWNFSYHEIGLYDLRAMFDFVLEETGRDRLYFVSHSMGQNELLVLLSKLPEYNSKIAHAVGLGPPMFNNPMPHIPLKIFYGFYCFWRIKLGHNNVLPIIHDMSAVSQKLCALCGFTKYLCELAYESLGPTTEYDESIVMPAMQLSVSTTSMKAVTHLSDNYIRDTFEDENNLPYDLSLVTAPVTSMYSDNDYIATPEAIKKLTSRLPNGRMYRVPLTTFNHLDFIFGRNVADLVYKEIFNIFEKKNNFID